MGKRKSNYEYLNVLGDRWTQDYIVYGTKDKKTGKEGFVLMVRYGNKEMRRALEDIVEIDEMK